MITYPTALQDHFEQEVTTLAVCWYVRYQGQNGKEVRGTEHDRDITITTTSTAYAELVGDYSMTLGITGSGIRSSSDIAVDNLDVIGAIPIDPYAIADLTAADIDAGLLDDAFVILFLVNWAAPDDGQIILRAGTVGEIRRTSEGQYTTELRGMTQPLAQTVTRTYGVTCDATLGDARCKYVIQPPEESYGVVTAVTNNRVFSATIQDAHPAGFYNGGFVLWLDGENAGRRMEIKRDTNGNSPDEMELFMPLPRDIVVGESFTIFPGCDKSMASCKGKFNNLANFRGHGAWISGINEAIAFATQKRKKKKKNPTVFNGAFRGFGP